MDEPYHRPVMVEEVVKFLNPGRGGIFFDGTLGGGGHSDAILSASNDARVIGVDQDPEALEVAGQRLARYGNRVSLIRANFADAAEDGTEPLAGALLDLGISSRHIDVAERGFSFRPGTPLDMRMARGEGASAADLLNELDESDLADVFYKYGEERKSRRLAREVVRRRPMKTSDDLLSALQATLGPRANAQDKARIFQALRVAVNDELSVLERALPALRDRLEDEGVLVVLSYHSLEDRMVKNEFREWSRECVCPPDFPVCRCRGRALGELLTRKPVNPSDAELQVNVRARSAHLRAWRKVA